MSAGLADAVRMARRPHEGLEKLYRRHGPVCTIGAGPFRYTYLLGPDANRFVIGHSRLFRWREAFEALIPVDGETALIVSEGPDHTSSSGDGARSTRATCSRRWCSAGTPAAAGSLTRRSSTR